MKPFNLEAAKRGEPIQTRSGQAAYFIGMSRHPNNKQPVIIETEAGTVFNYGLEGCYLPSKSNSDLDIFMAPKTIRAHAVTARYPDGDRVYSVFENASAANNEADYYNAKGAARVSTHTFEFQE